MYTYLTSPFPFPFPYLTFPSLTLPYLTLPYLTLPYLTSPYLTLPYLTLPFPCITEAAVRTELMEQVPQIAVLCHEYPTSLGGVVAGNLVPMVVRYLTDPNNQVSWMTWIWFDCNLLLLFIYLFIFLVWLYFSSLFSYFSSLFSPLSYFFPSLFPSSYFPLFLLISFSLFFLP